MRIADRIVQAVLVLPAVLLAGCGGGGLGAQRSAPLRLQLDWAARGRSVTAPSSALSCRIELFDPSRSPASASFGWTVNRLADPSGYTQSWVSPEPVLAKNWQLQARFYAGADATGDLVGTANASFRLREDGTGVGTVTTSRRIASVAVIAGQSLEVGETKELAFTARDAASAIVAVSPGSAIWSVDPSTSSVLAFSNGQAAGGAAGDALVSVAVDGVTSSPTSVTVNAPAPKLRYGLVWRTIGGQSKILFGEGVAGNMSIYSINPDGTGKALYAQIGLNTSTFDVAADGQTIVFEGSPLEGSSNIYRKDVSTPGAVQLTSNSYWTGSPTISPDGSRIVFGTVPAYGTTYSMNRDGSNVTGLLDLGPPYHYTGNRYSQDGTLLIRTEGYNADERLFTSDPSGANKTYITGPNGFGQSDVIAALSPDKSKVVYVTSFWTGQSGRMNGWYDISVTSVASGGRTRLTNATDSPCANMWPEFSPDGSRIAFLSNRNGGEYHLYTMSATDGSDVRQLTH